MRSFHVNQYKALTSSTIDVKPKSSRSSSHEREMEAEVVASKTTSACIT